MERSESAGINPNTGSDQTNFGGKSGNGSDQTTFQNSDVSRPSTAGSETEQVSGGITGRVKSVGSSIKDKASNIPGIIADGLEAGANALRHNRPSGGSSAGGSVALANDSTVTAVTDTLATGMQSSAEWLRDADLDKVKDGVEKQVKEHPARSLLIALGAGYLIGKALRR
jgi:hypothetical protein